MNIKIIRNFPDASDPKFSFAEWDKQFLTHNVILNGSYNNIYYKEHWTPLSIKCAYNGAEYYIKNGIRFAVDDKCFLVLNEGTLYESCIESEKKVESFTLNFTAELTQNVISGMQNCDNFMLENYFLSGQNSFCFFEKLYRYDEKLSKLLIEIRALSKINPPDSELINEKLHFLIEQLYRLQFDTFKEADNYKASRRTTRLELFKRLNLAKDFIYSNYQKNITLGELAAIACLSPHHLLRKFKAHFGVTPYQYLINRRLEAVKDELVNTSKSISEICLASGYEDLSSFSRLFKKQNGINPEGYRREFGSKKSIFA